MINIPQLCIRRPALTIVLSLILSIVGFMSYQHLPLRWVPNVNPPVISIYTSYPGASAELVENDLSTPIEAVLSGIDGIESIQSNSHQGESNVTLNFKLGHNMNLAAEDVRTALERFNGRLPTGAKPPEVAKADTTADTAILYLAVYDKERTAKELTDYVEQFVKPHLELVEGVASILAYGERTPAMRIWLDPAKMTASNITVDEINRVLGEQNASVPSGQIRSAQRFYNVVTHTTLNTPDQFNDVILRADQKQMVRLKDVGEAVVDADNFDSSFRVRGQAAVALGIFPQSTANPLQVAKNILAELPALQKNLPAGMHAEIAYNQADFISASIHQVYRSLIEAILLVLFVIFIFLASWRAACIPIVTIPICLISTFTLLYWFGFSINTITLMAFVLAIGLVVDDAIVMLENTTRHIEAGMTPLQAALQSSREIIFPIIAMTLTLAAVYLPIAWTSGLLGSVLNEFALTIAGTVIISGVIGLTLSPMMCSRLLTANQAKHFQFALLQNKYEAALRWVLTKRSLVLGVLLLLGLVGYGVSHFLSAELSPAEDMDEVDAYISAPRNASFQYTDGYAKQLEKIFQQVPEAKSYFAEIGSWSPTNAYLVMMLKPRKERKRSADDIAAWLNLYTKQLPGVDANAFVPPPPLAWSSGAHGDSIALKIMSATDYKTLHAVMQQLIAAVDKSPIFQHADNQLKWDGEQFEVNIDREKAADMQVPVQNITSTISTLIAGREAGHFEYNGKQYNILVQMNQTALANPNIISELYVRNVNNTMVPMSGLVTLRESTSPEVLPHFDRLRADTLRASLKPGYSLAQGVKVLQNTAAAVLPDNTKYTFTGMAREYLESSGKMSFTFCLALIFIYLILVAQFESFIDPFIILLTVPFAVIGALLTLMLAGGSLNIYSEIGLVTLIGLIAKHGILITEFANQEYLSGQSIQEAVIIAAKLRLRPILMTTAAMVLGAVPLAIATGPGAEARQQIGWVIVGGLTFGTFFSLIVVPVAYTFLARFRKMEQRSPIIQFPQEVSESA